MPEATELLSETAFGRFMLQVIKTGANIRRMSEKGEWGGKRYPQPWKLEDLSKPTWGDPFLQVEWTTGGMTGGSCWDDGTEDNHRSVDGDSEPTFKEFDDILTAICPHISFLQYRAAENELIKRNRYSENEYYGNYTDYAVKTVDLRQMFNYLAEKNFIDSN